MESGTEDNIWAYGEYEWEMANLKTNT